MQISELARVAFIPAFTRRLRDGEINQQTHRALILRFQSDLRERFEVLPFSTLVVEEASRLVQALAPATPLRTLDAIQFAFYTTLCDLQCVFVSADKRLLDLVEAAGSPVSSPSPN